MCKKTVSKKSGSAPETEISFFGFLYSQKDKNAGHDMIPAKPRPETPSLWDGRRKSTTFQSNFFVFFVFVFILLRKIRQRNTKQARTGLFVAKTINVSTFGQKCLHGQKTTSRKNDSRILGPTMRMESVPEGTPSLPFFKNYGVTN